MAKNNLKITVKAQHLDAAKIKTDLLAISVYSDARKTTVLDSLDKKLDGAISKLKKLGDFKAARQSCKMLYTNGKIPAQRVLLIGLGKSKDSDAHNLRTAAAKAAFEAVNAKAGNLALCFETKDENADLLNLGKTLAEAIHFGGYRYNEFVSQSKDEPAFNNLSAVIICQTKSAENTIKKGLRIGQIIGTAQNFARTLCNRPGNMIYPASLAKIAKKIAAANPSLSCTVFDEKKLLQKKMGGILAVGQGSANKPAIIVLKYSPKKAIKTAPIALVGKAITFDSGGISLKPSANMSEMKYDMSGGASVLMAMDVIAKLKPAKTVYGIICAAENRPDGKSYLPGDIITTYSGKTVEILNTDAEGRMVLCDGISYAQKDLKCNTVIDLATLTGACVVALGKHKAGLFSNNDDLSKKLQLASENTAEPLWPLPYEQAYADEIKGKISDLKNIGDRWGGSCSAAAFLGEFAKDIKWAHLDIAPTMDASEPMKKYTTAGSVGFGVRILADFVCNTK